MAADVLVVPTALDVDVPAQVGEGGVDLAGDPLREGQVCSVVGALALGIVVAAPHQQHELGAACPVRRFDPDRQALGVRVAVQIDHQIEFRVIGFKQLQRAHIGGAQIVLLVVRDVVGHAIAQFGQRLRECLTDAHHAVLLVGGAPGLDGFVGIGGVLGVGLVGVGVIDQDRPGIHRRDRLGGIGDDLDRQSAGRSGGKGLQNLCLFGLRDDRGSCARRPGIGGDAAVGRKLLNQDEGEHRRQQKHRDRQQQMGALDDLEANHDFTPLRNSIVWLAQKN